MKKFSVIKNRAAKRKGGSSKLEDLLPVVSSVRKLRALPNDRVLATMTRCINNAGFNWSVIEKKWPQFEEAFHGFDVDKLSMLPPEDWEAYLQDKRIVRNWQKIDAVRSNVDFVLEVAAQHGSFAKFVAAWPCSDQVGLLKFLKANGKRLGGNTGQYFLRFIGKDSFMLTQDVVTALQDAGVDINDQPTSQRDMLRAQEAFNEWHEQTGLSYTNLSRIASYSAGSNYPVGQLFQSH
ncbi:MAG: DNA-3-methyladenine glycosylase I [Gammaproteobacteria bacterium]